MKDTLPVLQDMVENLDTFYQLASDFQLAKGKTWYSRVHTCCQKIADIYEVSVFQVAGITARLSPNLHWKRNLRATVSILEHREKVEGYPKNVEIAREIENGRFGTSFLEVKDAFGLGAPKISAFYCNIALPKDTEHVTVDRWMLRAVYSIKKQPPNDRVVRFSEYAKIQRAVKILAQEKKLIPNQVQAVVWEVIRSIYG